VATLTSPFSTSLDTTSLTEGNRQLVASAQLGGRTFRSPPRTLIVDRTRPAAPTVAPALTNAPNPVTVSGTAEAGATVTVLEGATQLASGVGASAGGAWAAAFPLAEGSHALTATATDAAGNVSVLSSPATVTVDRTAPTVLSTTPAASAATVWSRDPITVTFSEPVSAATLTAQNVSVKADGVDLALQSSALSADGLTLTLTPSPAALPPVPATVVATLSTGVTDLAGNPLALTSWTWSLPEWLAPAAPLFPAGDGVTIFRAGFGADSIVRATYSPSPVRQLAFSSASGGVWVSGTTPDPSTSFNVTDFAMAVDSAGHSTVAYLVSSQVRVTRFNGSTWTVLAGAGSTLNIVSSNAAAGVRVAVDGLDRPVVLWAEASALYAKRWNGSTWDLVLNAVPFTSGAYALAIDKLDVPVAAVGGSLSNNSAFHVDTTTEVSLAYDGSNRPVAASLVGTTVQVVVPGNPPASFFAPLGPALGTTALHPTIVYRDSGPPGQQLLLAYEELAAPAAMRVLAWSGSQWNSISTAIGTPSAAFQNAAQLQANASGVVAVTWSESKGVAAQLVAKRYNR
jgi:hypothetical protein